mmetsp:Transcript_9136/g.10982  ORF Transcript_9136/g.10982 Transcript_9136/m.10982 type:complete len:309 (-) Transcript_9136:228-1154(-)
MDFEKSIDKALTISMEQRDIGSLRNHLRRAEYAKPRMYSGFVTKATQLVEKLESIGIAVDRIQSALQNQSFDEKLYQSMLKTFRDLNGNYGDEKQLIELISELRKRLAKQAEEAETIRKRKEEEKLEERRRQVRRAEQQRAAALAAMTEKEREKVVLFERGVIDDYNANGETLLCVASEKGQLEEVASLIKAGADINKGPRKGHKVKYVSFLFSLLCCWMSCGRYISRVKSCFLAVYAHENAEFVCGNVHIKKRKRNDKKGRLYFIIYTGHTSIYYYFLNSFFSQYIFTCSSMDVPLYGRLLMKIMLK